MTKTLHDLYTEAKNNHEQLSDENTFLLDSKIKSGMVLIYNGGYFSDCSFFSKNKEYKIKSVSPYAIKVSSNMSFMSINVLEQGLKAFNIKEEL